MTSGPIESIQIVAQTRESYTFDNANRLISTTYNAGNEQTKFGGRRLSYDADDDLTGDETNTYTWDARNHLITISCGNAARFLYGGVGRRQAKIINSTTTQYLYDGLNPLQELDGDTPLLRSQVDQSCSENQPELKSNKFG